MEESQTTLERLQPLRQLHQKSVGEFVRAGRGDKPHGRFGRGRLMLLSHQDLASYLTPNAQGNAWDKTKGNRYC